MRTTIHFYHVSLESWSVFTEAKGTIDKFGPIEGHHRLKMLRTTAFIY
jgi:hypothetical protein